VKKIFTLVLFLALAFARSWAAAQDLEFHPPQNAADPAADQAMRDLAVRTLPVYQENNQDRYFANLSALQLVAGDYSSAYNSRQSLRERRRATVLDRSLVYDIYARARAIEVESKIPFAQAFTLSFRNVVPRLNDFDANIISNVFSTPLPLLQETVQRTFDQKRGKGSVTIAEAIELSWAYLAFDAYRSFGPIAAALNADEDRRRYITEESTIKVKDGATISAVLVRPKLLSKMPTLLEFTAVDAQTYQKECAAYGYVGVVAYARGVRKSTGEMIPFERDGDDARAVIEWITKQEWSNGKVGMFGSGYSGFAAWTATKRLPPALKAIATTDAMAPGVDMPMSGNIFRNSAYRWILHATDTKAPGDKSLDEDATFRAFNQDWYTSGRSYRHLGSTSGNHSPIFDRWLSHPSYDWYWQRMLPNKEQLAHLNIPVLTMTGYFADSEPAALFYFNEHHRNNPKANHTLLVGPYDESAIVRGPTQAYKGYVLDQAAYIDLRRLRYEWFDSVLKTSRKPPLLAERVNYQVMGSNEWRHLPALPAVDKSALKFFLEANPEGDSNRLAPAKSAETTFLPQTFDLADRSDVKISAPSSDIVSKALTIKTGEIFASEQLKEPTEIGGLFSGEFDFRVNKMDMDIVIALYEQLPTGEFVKLFDPSFEVRASYAGSRVQRRLLKSGVRQKITFKSERLLSRRLQAGSRIIMTLGVNKRSDRQINYGTGGDVNEESIENADVPLKIRWYNTSFIEIPVHGDAPPAPAAAKQ
jgi:putative CocE/NonD family hydrolase